MLNRVVRDDNVKEPAKAVSSDYVYLGNVKQGVLRPRQQSSGPRG